MRHLHSVRGAGVTLACYTGSQAQIFAQNVADILRENIVCVCHTYLYEIM